jgi:DNA repair exonuclease SbcCD ATPase subunit
MRKIDKLNEIISKGVAEIKYAKSQLAKAKKECIYLSNQLETLEEYKTLIGELSRRHQEKVKAYFEDIVTTALQSVHGEEYSFVITIEDRRDAQEPHFFLNKNGVLLEPKEDTCGGSVLDVISYTLRLACLKLESDNIQILLLDEPLTNTKRNRLQAVCDVLKGSSEQLETQLIIISHEDELIEAGKNVIRIGE